MRNCFGWCVHGREEQLRRRKPPPRSSIPDPKSRYPSKTVPPKEQIECITRDLNLALNLEAFTFGEIKKITKKFSKDRLVGRGGFGTVYKGFITQGLRNGLQPQPVAVRVLDIDGVLQGHQEWMAEVIFLGHHPHPNLVKLIGYTCEGEHRVLIYEYLVLGSVENHLHSRVLQPLSWHLRMKVAYGVAKGLTYIHEAETPVILGKITTRNILLDKDYNPKLSDFEYVRNESERNIHHAQIIHKIDYKAPEYLAAGHSSSKSDVYSFGVLLLELVTGRKPFDMSRPCQEKNLVLWARPFLEKKKCLKIVDPRLEGNYPIEGVYQVAMLTCQCLNESIKLRPSMREVMEKLKPHQVTNNGEAMSSN